MAKTRTAKSLINSSVSLGFYFLTMCITLLSRPIFFRALSSEVSGLRDIVGKILGTMGLAELGIGTAVSYCLYKPLFEKDTKTINEIISVQAWFYRRIASFVIAIAVILLFFFPYLFRNLQAPLWYAYLTFAVFFSEMLFTYLINYRAILFSADQRSYRLSLNLQGFVILKKILQILALYFLPAEYEPYVIYLLLDLSVSLIGVYVLEKMIQKDYPWLKPKPKEGKKLLKKYKVIVTKTKQIFIHKVGEIALHHGAALILWQFTSETIVGYYTSYMILSGNISTIINNLFSSIGAGIGNLVAEGNKDKILKFFWEYLTIRNFLVTVASFGFYSFASALIPLWMGDNAEYILPNSIVIMITLIAHLGLIRSFEAFLNAYGLYQDVWAPIAEAAINILSSLGLAFLFRSYYVELGFSSPSYAAIVGILIGVTLSLLIIVFGWKSIFLFRNGFNLSPWIFWRNFIKFPAVSILFILMGSYALDWLALDFSTIPSFLFNAIWTTAVFGILLFLVYWPMSQGMRDITERFWIIFTEKMLPKLKHKLGI